MKKIHIFQLISVGIFLVGMYFILGRFGVYLQSYEVQNFINQTGIFAPLVFSVLYLATLVFAPITGFPFWITSVGLFGILKTVIMVYFLSIIGAVVNFYIARKLGRPILLKLVGDNGIKKIDKLSKNFGIEVLILARLFQGFIFEWISYASGLTNINFKKYFLITVFASIPLNLVSLFFGLRTSDLGELFISITVVNYILMTIPFIYFLGKNIFRKILTRF